MLKEEVYEKYELVVGLEIHVQLQTKSKAYSSDSAEYGSAPNTHISAISLGHPGTLPRFNENTLQYGVRLGLSCGSEITYENQFARKNYFYADLPKGYQITQDKTPLCLGGSILIKDDQGKDKRIGITRIHMEEDSGKSIHDLDPFNTLVDLNRAGVPLLEIVSEPEIRTPQEAYNYLTEVRQLVRYLEICDGNMEEGSMRCDANVSVRLKGAKEFGQRTETKNLNSIRNVFRAIEYEFKRQIEVIEAGSEIKMETMGFDAVKGTTSSMRSKELAHDYRYFPEPDLQAVYVDSDYIEKVRKDLPALPSELIKKFTSEMNLSTYDAEVLTEEKYFALYFDELTRLTKNYKAAANWMMGAVKSYLNENALTIQEFKIKPDQIAEIIQLIDEGKISNSIANQKIFPYLIEHTNDRPRAIAESNNWIQESDSNALEGFISEAIAMYPEKVEAYRAGNKNLLGLFMGEVMKRSKGKADPKLTSQLLKEKLEN
ncbi:MAG: Asp-tRNA(Asn)/Glu-tRNA(Gln) amidotransferase subunit GatB [Bacteroidetes bacterium]|nr:MAG: Asp-tRNA(Asn)/Glu-tRNA(Gln) amidotransferase subunit GatB [Bacteroidota bacterium]MBL1145515.1 Asp-tRNA(Asn)/Glu-tRNA(Gln) amidotransferase subunit GatB [Bacteroidota bacterium]NOG58312.1 Asp-tRNA(Asn)/Glu-tRNA(Gln) amidotransferase subunit GatB [Bacteroidota bacterium]